MYKAENIKGKKSIRTEKIDRKSKAFPEKLRRIPNPPKQIYCTGDLSLLEKKSISVVGSRKFTLYGKNVAMMIGRRLGESGIPVVSGLANGIDGFAHEGVLEAGGKIIGVLGSGIEKMTPRRNRKLMMQGLEMGGLVVSEYEPGEEARPYTFPARNRIISALGEILVIVEANFNSGALITAQNAADQGKEIFVVPGNINSQFSMGSNLLIRDGATPLIVIDDLIREIGIVPPDIVSEERTFAEDEKTIIEELKNLGSASIDILAEKTGKSPASVGAILTILEIKGVVVSVAGQIHLAK
ncbi:MAG TPA: DNA-protecting protein DprA [Mogibacterium sp.]|nr:DNA-protecting protein DprA [Mogibacterium sp.]